ncbi:MAG: SusC/RagA family TonB-linked outer membrane protein [Saprospiraceae bacterium]
MKLPFQLRKIKIFLFTILFFGFFTASAQTYEISGSVSDETGTPLIGVSVAVKNTTIGTATDFEGNFNLSGIQRGATLVFSYIGYRSVERVVESETYLNISLEPDAQQLSEVVVTALGIKREQKALGYAVQEISGEDLQKVQGVDAATSLTGKIAGVLVQNSSDFNVTPTISVRGEEPLLVIDGIAYANKTLSDISPEDIESMTVLKGATASALYGFRGSNGAILITTKNGSSGKLGVTVDYTTNTMFAAGFLAIPEKQTIYGRGTNNTYDINSDQSWGTAMNGSMQMQWDPIEKVYSERPYMPVGANNFSNFLEQGYVTNNNLNVGFKGDQMALRSSFNWTENKGQYPNSLLNKYTYTLGGDINLEKFRLTSNLSYAKRESPNMGSNGYTSYDPMYTLLIWSSADFNILDYQDNYWIVKDKVQNNQFGVQPDGTYKGKNQNNPYFDRYEKTNQVSRDIFNADLSMSYDVASWLTATVRSGLDFYMDRGQLRVSQGSYVSTGNTGIPGNPYTWNGTKTGAYLTGRTQGFSSNSDLLLTGRQKVSSKFDVEYLAGGTIFYQRDDNVWGQTVGGIAVPGFFSLNASVNPAAVKESKTSRQVNSVFGRIGLSWNGLIYLEATGRNDWSSTLAGPGVPKSDISYFYPSISGSFVVSELLPESTGKWLDLLKIRNSWTQSKTPASIYAINPVFTVNPGTWNDQNGATAPHSLYSSTVNPNAANTYEAGIQGIFFKNRLSADVAYYSTRMYDFLKFASISSSSGISSVLVNTEEEITRRGWEVSLFTTPVKTADWQVDVIFNWTTYKRTYAALDSTYSTKKPWIQVGNRVDAFVGRDFLQVPSTGEYIYSNGRIQRSGYDSVFGYSDPDWIWGISPSIRYKNFNLFLSFDGVVGGLLSTRTESYMWQAGVHPNSVTPERALDVADPGSKNYIGDGVMVVAGSVQYDTDGNITSDTREYERNNVATTYKQAAQDLHNSSAWGGSANPNDVYARTFLKLRVVSLSYNLP